MYQPVGGRAPGTANATSQQGAMDTPLREASKLVQLVAVDVRRSCRVHRLRCREAVGMVAVAHRRSRLAAVAPGAIRVFVVQVVVVHGLPLTVPLDTPNVAVALVQVCVAQPLALVSAWPVDAKAVQRIAE